MLFADTVKKLSDLTASNLHHYGHETIPFPSVNELNEIIDLCRSLLFPGYYGKSKLNEASLQYHIGVGVERVYEKLVRQIVAGLAFTQHPIDNNCPEQQGGEEADDSIQTTACLWYEARMKAQAFVNSLPELRAILATDVVAHYRNDPAAHNLGEVILCYPGMRAICNYRLAHKLLELDVPLIPRMITELAHSETSIDIHPGATIGHSFTIDHGTGVVIGATAILGHHVTIYQGVTLGAKNFPQEEDGSLVKGIARHPILGNNVIVYANATCLGRIHIGDNCVIGGNLWVTDDVAPNTKLFFKKDK